MENFNLNRRTLITAITAGSFLSSNARSFALAQDATPEMDHGEAPGESGDW